MRFTILMTGVLIALVACAAPAMPTATPAPPTQVPIKPPAASAPSCAATYPVPGNDFRADDPKKLDQAGKPKLVEFFAVW